MTRCSRLLVPLVLLVLAAPAAGLAADCGPDCLGIWFDEAGTEPCLTDAPIGVVTAYLVLSDPTMEALVSIDFAFVLEGGVLVTSVNFGQPLICDPFEPGAWCHVWDPPRATSPSTLLATIEMFYTGGSPATVGLRSLAWAPDDRVRVGLPDGSEVPLNPSTGPGMPLAQVGGECAVVPQAERAWGALKSLYR